MRQLKVGQGFLKKRLALAARLDRGYVGQIKLASESVSISVLEAMAKVLALSIATLLVELDERASRPKPLRRKARRTG